MPTLSLVRLVIVALSFGLVRQGAAQATGADTPSSTCWRFGFGSWTPALDWERAGHGGNAKELASRVQRVRDSVFARDTSAARNQVMMWEKTRRGWSVVLFPDWWPVGVKVDFDSVLAGGREMTGTATALVADANKEPATARVRAVRCPG